MTQEQFSRLSFRHSQVIIFHQEHPTVDIECMLLAVDFECGVLKLVPFDSEYYEDESFFASFLYCDIRPKTPTMKIIVNGKTKRVPVRDRL